MPLARINRLPTEHADVIHDVAYDFYGERMATCSSDLTVRVWERGRCVASWKAHDGSVWRLAWAHPEFGQVLASCSFDRAVHIWEEPPGGARGGAWQRKAALGDARESVTSIAFAPRHLGLRLGALSADGKLRVYDALDVMQLGSWSLVDEVDVPGALCFAWGQHTAGSVCLVVGYSDGSAVILADGGGRKWTEVCRLSDARDAIQSVSWAPHIGRTMQLIAMGGRDGAVYVYTLRPPAAGAGPAAGGWEAKLAARLPEHGDAVWRVEWNATGSLLASSGDDGTVRVWQPDATGQWRCVSTVKSDGAAMDA